MKEHLKKTKENILVTLVADPENPYDAHAIRVLLDEEVMDQPLQGFDIGFVPKQGELTFFRGDPRDMDRFSIYYDFLNQEIRKTKIQACVKKITGSSAVNLGVVLEISLAL